MTIQKPIVAMIYDFDGTLAPGNMQEYDFLKEIGVTGVRIMHWVRRRTQPRCSVT